MSYRAAVSQLNSSVPASRSAGLARCSGFTLDEVRVRDMGKRNEGTMHVDENGEETALTCTSEWVLNQR